MIDKTKLAERIRQIAGLSDDEKSSLLALLNEQKRYGLVWEDKAEEVEKQLQDELPVLIEVADKRLPVVDGAPNHVLIEADNLHALTCLSYTHEGAIDVIYIDPPYNTGKKDFFYNDSYVDKDDSFRHSKWLSFMSKRLRIARRLLSDEGVIFISIDDKEQAALKLLCDEVFGRDKFVTCVPRITKLQRSAQEKHMDVSHDYLLCYSIKDDFAHITEREFDESSVKRDNVGFYLEGDTKAILADKSKGYSAGGDYDFEYNGKIYSPVDKNGVRNRWLWKRERMEAAAKLGILVETANSLRMQLYLDVKFDDKTNTMVPKNANLIFHTSDFMIDNRFSNSTGSTELKDVGTDLFARFNNPKPLAFIKSLLLLQGKDNAKVLDFFAGSGTTLHAVMQQNAADGGQRQCILVTNNENGICENVTYERNRRVIQGYTNAKGDKVEGLTNNNLRYYRTGYVPRERTQRNMRALVNASTDLLCIQNNLYTEQDFTIDGKKVRKDIARWFGGMLIIYREEFAEEIANEIAKMDLGGEKLKVYIFSPGRYAFDDTFEDVQDKVELVALPAAIYDAYKRVLPKRKEKTFEEEAKEDIPTTLF